MKPSQSAVYRIILDYPPRNLNITMVQKQVIFISLALKSQCFGNKFYESFLRTSSHSDYLLCTLFTVNSMPNLPKQDDNRIFESILNKKHIDTVSRQ